MNIVTRKYLIFFIFILSINIFSGNIITHDIFLNAWLVILWLATRLFYIKDGYTN